LQHVKRFFHAGQHCCNLYFECYNGIIQCIKQYLYLGTIYTFIYDLFWKLLETLQTCRLLIHSESLGFWIVSIV
jgi:hypothetical protein